MHGLQVCLFKYITVAASRIYAQLGEDAAKGWEVGGHALKIVMEITLLIRENHEKSWNCVFEFLWEPCNEEQSDRGLFAPEGKF